MGGIDRAQEFEGADAKAAIVVGEGFLCIGQAGFAISCCAARKGREFGVSSGIAVSRGLAAGRRGMVWSVWAAW